MSTIGDVARVAGVSRSTVSHALSGKRPISLATRERIDEAIRELKYTANAGARALATSKSSILGLIVPFTPEEFAPATMQYVLAITETARSLGYDVLLVTEDEGSAGITRISESNLVDGVILLDVKRHDDRLAALAEARCPAVLIGVPEGDVELDVVDLDFTAAGGLLVQHLHDEGHREAVFVTLPDAIFRLELAYAWLFRDAVVAKAAELGVELHAVEGDADPERRAAAISSALDAHPEATALLVHNDGALADLQQILHERTLRVPEDLAVVSLYPEQFGRMFSLPYTAIETSAARVAADAVHLLASRIDDPEIPFTRRLLTPVMIDRGTSRRH
ncbi:LacI family DNA-binding transcriptional regulator [Promicromonospora sp. Populi]|uniref:LacI family DNA-binding transcriptional regulator n=1 Tax=Promicromonospora sp. Populi TaxID=3239420 RepID=UPI0034E1FBF4